MMAEPPRLISIVTPCLNAAQYISDAIESVLCQGSGSFEHIIVDGGSTDGTLELLAGYPHVKTASGPDMGMYDALNKGLELATGDVVGILNSDDLYADGAFSAVTGAFREDPILAVAGRALVFSQTANGTRAIVGGFSPDSASLLVLSTIGSPFLNAWFFRKSVFDKIGKFSTEYRIAADREFMLRVALSGLEYATLDSVVYQYRQHAGSMTFDMTDQKLERIVRELVQMTSYYLQRGDLPKEARQLLRQARTQDTLTMAVRAGRNGELRKMSFFMAAGLRFDPAWGLRYAHRALGGVIRLASQRVELAMHKLGI